MDYNYQRLVDEIRKLESKWGITVLDLYNDAEMSAISSQDYVNYVSDVIHPRQLGYLEWWTPKFEVRLARIVK